MSESKKNFVCQQDKRRFATAAALKQHRAAAHGTSGGVKPAQRKKNSGPRNGPGLLSSRNQMGRKVSGSDMLGLINIKAPGTSGDRLLQVQLNPRLMSGSRLAAESKLWARWRPLMLVLRVVTSASSYVGGMYSSGWSANPDERLPRGAGALNKIATYQPNVTSQIFKESRLVIPCETSRKWYLLEGPNEDSAHGVVQAALAAPINNLSAGSTVTLYLHLDWSVEFEGPDLPAAEEADTIYADDAYTPYFTDSISDWAAGTKLTLKAHSGGSAVPFPAAEPGVVYKIDSRANLLAYNSAAANVTVKVVYGVRIRDYPVAAMAMFTDLAKAKAYASSGDTANCMTYYAVGAYGEPENPAWTGQDAGFAFDLSAKAPVAESTISTNLVTDPRSATAVEFMAKILDAVSIKTKLGDAINTFVDDPLLENPVAGCSGHDPDVDSLGSFCS